MRPLVELDLSEHPNLRMRRLSSVGNCGLGPHPSSRLWDPAISLGVQKCFLPRLGPDQPVVQVLVKSQSSGERHQLHFFHNHCKDLLGCGQVERKRGELEHLICGKTLGILSLGGWGCEGKSPIDLSTIPIPLELGRS